MREKSLKAMLIILLLAVLGLGGYIVYDKFLSKELNKTEVKQETKKEVKEETKKEESQKEDLDAVANILVNKINTYNINQLEAIDKNLQFSNSPTNEQLITMEYYYIYKSKSNNTYDENYLATKEEVDKYFKSVYNIQLNEYPNIVDWNDNQIDYVYDNNSQKYLHYVNPITDTFNHYNLFPADSITEIVTDINKNKDIYSITLAKIYTCGPNVLNGEHITSDALHKTVLPEFDQFIKSDIDCDEEAAANYFKANKDKYKTQKPQYKYTFKKENNDYYLISFETIK